jgi:CheY-like chemotaxis protein
MEAVGQLTGGVAHDFNNILTVITGTIEILADAVADRPELANIAKLIDEAAERGADLTRHLLAFARKQPLQPRQVDVNALLEAAGKFIRPTLGEQVEIEIVSRRTTWPAFADPHQLTTTVLNLAINARDAMPRGGVLSIEISRQRLDADYARVHPQVRTGDYVLISVTDTGTGMSSEVRERAFEPFFTTKGLGAGTGLGLSMVYGFAKQSGGQVQLHSDPGQGTSVRILLPAIQRAADFPVPADLGTADAKQIPRGCERILVVEDDPRVRRVAVSRLLDAGYAVVEAANGSEALDIFPNYPDIALLFTDIVMPGGIAGDELAQRVRVLRPDMKVLFTSGYAEPTVAGRQLAEEGSWLKKPYTARELAVRLRELLD